jgi:uncharacterized membrane protein YjgN (DUF898 family)
MDTGTGETQVERTHRFAFTGRAGEYFRIWMVSLCLSLLTLGVYSAWGKVRKRRYLYAHTRLDGDGFDYRASPLAILRGRLIAVALFGGLALTGHFVPLAQIALVLLLVALSPWIVVASARFTARNSTYRNIAFSFDGRFGEAARVFVGGALIALATLGLAYPWYRMRRARFIAMHHRYGATRFATDLGSGGFVLTYLLAVLMLAGVVIAFAALSAAVVVAWRVAGADAEPALLAQLSAIPLYAAYVAVYAYIRARTFNLIAAATTVGPLRLAGTLRARRLAWLYVSNIAAILATLGIATPWATIRLARYRTACLAARSFAPLESFAAGASSRVAATGSEVSDLFDVDVSL